MDPEEELRQVIEMSMQQQKIEEQKEIKEFTALNNLSFKNTDSEYSSQEIKDWFKSKVQQDSAISKSQLLID